MDHKREAINFKILSNFLKQTENKYVFKIDHEIVTFNIQIDQIVRLRVYSFDFMQKIYSLFNVSYYFTFPC